MPAPILLVDDDLSTIASVKRALTRDGFEVVLATSAADAVIAFGHHLPALVVLSPNVEGGRAEVVLEELKIHPDAGLLRVLLLGETLPGFGYPVVPLPIEPESFLQLVHELVGAPEAAQGWQVFENPAARTQELPAVSPDGEPDAWRATRRSPAPGPADTALLEPHRPGDETLQPGDETAPAQPEEEESIQSSAFAAETSEPPLGSSSESTVMTQTPQALLDDTREVPPPEDEEAAAESGGLRLRSRPRGGALKSGAQQASASPAPEASEETSAEVSEEVAPAESQATEGDLGESAPAETEAATREVSDEVAALESPPRARFGIGETPEHTFEEVDQDFEATRERIGQLEAKALGRLKQQEKAAAEAAAKEALGEGAADESQVAAAEAPSAESEEVQARPSAHADLHDAALEPRPTVPTGPPAASAPLPDASPGVHELEARLFGDLEEEVQAQVEAEATARVESTLANMPVDAELQRLEDEVRAEAARRRKARQAPQPPPPAMTPEPTPPTEAIAPGGPSTEASFASLDADGDDEVRLRERLAAGKVSASRAEQAAEQARKDSQQRRKADEKQAQAREDELQDAIRSAAAAEDLVRDERAARQRLEADLEEVRSQLLLTTDELEQALKGAEQATHGESAAREKAERLAAKLKKELAEAKEKLETTRQALEAAEGERDEARAEVAEARTGWETERERLEGELHALRKQLQEVQDEAVTLAQALGEARADRSKAEEAVATSETAAREATQEAEQSEARTRELGEALVELQERHQALEAEQEQARTEAERAENELAELRAQAQAEKVRLDELTQALAAATARAKEAESAGAQMVARLEAQLNEGRSERDTLAQKLGAAEEETSRAQTQLDKVNQRAEELQAKAQQLEESQRLPLQIPDRPRLSVARAGPVKLGELARLVVQLGEAKVELKLELAVPGGRRSLWLKGGEVVAAESSFQHESMLDRARRDGLIDARQEKELKLLRNASPVETLSVLSARGWIREAERVPMAQRYVEQVVLEALSEPGCDYRLSEDPITGGAMEAAPLKTLLPMLAEALRRSLPADKLLESLGGSEAVPFTTDSLLDPRALGFSDKERRMLSYLDGEANVEDLALASSLKPEAAYRALLVAKLLGLLDLKLPERASAPPGPELDVARLESKYDQVQDADYFSILGLTREAGADEVERAWLRLSEEFDPIRFSGHPDASLQQRAAVVFGLIEEAARALRDDRRREEYARHLVD